MGRPARAHSGGPPRHARAFAAASAGAVIMRILSARITGVRVNRASARIEAVVVLRVEQNGDAARELRVPTSAPIVAAGVAPGAAPLKERLIASAKLILAMSADAGAVDDAETNRNAA